MREFQRSISNYRCLRKPPQACAGFSLFELVVFIISVAIIYATAANRFAEFPGEAERANFLAVTAQIQSAINLEMMMSAGLRNRGTVEQMAGANPMELLLETPSNYIGSYDFVDKTQLPRRSWYFDRQREELVYLVNDTDGVVLLGDGLSVPTDEIRFQVMLDFDEIDTATGLPISIAQRNNNNIPDENRRRRLKGVVMRPTIPFSWGQAEVDTLITAARNENAGQAG